VRPFSWLDESRGEALGWRVFALPGWAVGG